MIEHKTDEWNCIAKNVKIYLEFWIVHIYDVDAALVDCFDGANDEGGQTDAEEVNILLPLLNMVKKDTRLLNTIHSLFLSYV